MPFALLLIGILLVVSGVKNTQAQLGAQIVKDFSGAGSFWYWIFGLGLAGAVGYNANLRGLSRLFLILILVVFVLANRGFFAQLSAALKNIGTGAVAPSSAGSPATGAPSILDGASHIGTVLNDPNPLNWPSELGTIGGDIGKNLSHWLSGNISISPSSGAGAGNNGSTGGGGF